MYFLYNTFVALAGDSKPIMKNQMSPSAEALKNRSETFSPKFTYSKGKCCDFRLLYGIISLIALILEVAYFLKVFPFFSMRMLIFGQKPVLPQP